MPVADSLGGATDVARFKSGCNTIPWIQLGGRIIHKSNRILLQD